MHTERGQKPEPSVASISLNHEFATMSFDELLIVVKKRIIIKIATIECGSKITKLRLLEDGSFYTFIERTDKPKTIEDTTTSYMAVKKIIQEYADRLGQAFMYKFVSRNSNLKKWAETKGREIFNWSNEYQGQGDEAEYKIFEATINPQQAT